jgi:catechol 2,3-dioxygenase-like lactoylglutathione lyase family enzyme
MNVFYNTIVFVKDIKKSRQFYESIIGLKVEKEYDTIIFFENRFVIHNRDIIHQTIFEGKINLEEQPVQINILIYFETDNLEESFQHILKNNITLIHGIKTQEWGQQVFRFYDPDGYILEIGEAMNQISENRQL